MLINIFGGEIIIENNKMTNKKCEHENTMDTCFSDKDCPKCHQDKYQEVAKQDLEKYKQDRMMEEAIASAELAEEVSEQYQCKSYWENGKVLNCSCGKCDKEEVADWDWKKEYSELVKYIFYTKDPNYGAENSRNKNTIEIFITKTIAQEYEKGLEDGRNIEKRLNEKWKEELIEWLDTALFSTSNVLGGTKYQLEHLQAHIRDIINKIKNND